MDYSKYSWGIDPVNDEYKGNRENLEMCATQINEWLLKKEEKEIIETLAKTNHKALHRLHGVIEKTLKSQVKDYIKEQKMKAEMKSNPKYCPHMNDGKGGLCNTRTENEMCEDEPVKWYERCPIPEKRWPVKTTTRFEKAKLEFLKFMKPYRPITFTELGEIANEEKMRDVIDRILENAGFKDEEITE